jgi:RNA recognition motif-containing protein
MVNSPNPDLNVYVGNLHPHVSESDLMDLFRDLDPVKSHLFTNKFGRSRGFAVVEFVSTEQAQRAIVEKNNADLAGRKLEVCSLIRVNKLLFIVICNVLIPVLLY